MAPSDTPPPAAHQISHQLRLTRTRMASHAWLNWLFAAGFLLAALGLVVTLARFQAEGTPYLRSLFLALFAAFFGWCVVRWLMPFEPRPRVVPYFAQQLEEHGSSTSAAFERGRSLYLELAALDRLAASAGVRPPSDFGFAYDHYEQEVRWHPAAEGLRTIEALRQRLAGPVLETPGLAADLDALASVLQAAADRGVLFSLVLRLHEKDSLQAVMLWEPRKGSFW